MESFIFFFFLLTTSGDNNSKEKMTSRHHYMTTNLMVSCDFRRKRRKQSVYTTQKDISLTTTTYSLRGLVVFLLLRGSVIDLDNHEKRPKRNSFRWQTDSRTWNGTCAVICILVSCARSFISSEVTKFKIDARLMTLHRHTHRHALPPASSVSLGLNWWIQQWTHKTLTQ